MLKDHEIDESKKGAQLANMTDPTVEKQKYQVNITNSPGNVIGDNANVVQNFYGTGPGSVSPTRNQLLLAIHRANEELRRWPNDIAGVHLERSEVKEIVNWVINGESKERLGMLLDQPGGGKTVVMHDVLIELESANVVTLTIKADTLSGIRNQTDLADRLGLPHSVEECVRILSSEDLVVIILDQIDALSLALSRDQATLDVMLTTLRQLQGLEKVRIITSCRTFDLNNDPRLSTIKVDRKFQLQPLQKEQIQRVLQAIDINVERLLPEHQRLLTIPLHLDIYTRVILSSAIDNAIESYYTLQDLYAALWRTRIEVIPPGQPSPAERSTAIYRLVDTMQSAQQLTAPIAILDDCSEAASYLERLGLIRRDGRNWVFVHQTLFDYCYARRFVAQRSSLSAEILHGPQGLFERSQMVQVLAYLRGADLVAYQSELSELLFSVDLRVHLRLLLIGWFGSLLNPTSTELHIAQRLVQNRQDQHLFFQSIRANVGWFNSVKSLMLPSMLQSSDEQLCQMSIDYLRTMINSKSENVVAILKPYLGATEAWDHRIASCLFGLERWQNDSALDMLCNLLDRDRVPNRAGSFFYSFHRSHPAVGCRVLSVYLNRRLENLLVSGTLNPFQNHIEIERYLLGEHAIGELVNRAVAVCPEQVVENLLPWLIRASITLSSWLLQDSYPFDPFFATGWYGDHISEGAAFAKHIATALKHIALCDSSNFRSFASTLAGNEVLAPHRLLVDVYLAYPQEYANDIFDYLTSDPRRLSIGEPMESSHYDSCRLFESALRSNGSVQRLKLEQMILSLKPEWESRSLGRQGITQLQFLKSVPVELLGEMSRQRRRELEDKFPGYEPSPPKGIHSSGVGSPITQKAQTKMSNKAWIRAMKKYGDHTDWHNSGRNIMKGGIIELSRSYEEQVKLEPARFYDLAASFDDQISLRYVIATISGLVESTAPSAHVFGLVRRFAPRITAEFRRTVCGALQKKADSGVPDDLLDMMSDWALHDPDPEQELWQVPTGSGQLDYNGDPYMYGINTNRGASICAIGYCALKRNPTQHIRIFDLLEKVAEDPSTAVRTCVLEVLGRLISIDVDRTLAIFERLINGHSHLLELDLTHQFLYRTYPRQFLRIQPFIESMLSSPEDKTRRTGARLVCLAAFEYANAKVLEEKVMNGDHVMREGAAQVYARNLSLPNERNTCQRRLLQLIHDPNKQVRKCVGHFPDHLQDNLLHEEDVRLLIESFIDSPALIDGAESIIKFIAPFAADEHELALNVTERIIDTIGAEAMNMPRSESVLERDLARLPLSVYTHTRDITIKSRSIALFERLLTMGSWTAQQALADWDRR